MKVIIEEFIRIGNEFIFIAALIKGLSAEVVRVEIGTFDLINY